MQVKFAGTYTPRHLANVCFRIRRLFGGGGLLQRLGSMGLIGVALLVIPLFAALSGAPTSVLTWIPLGFIALGLVALNEWGIRREFAKGPLANQATSGHVGPDGFRIETANSTSEIRWPGIRNYACHPDYLLVVDQSNGVFAIPRDFFGSAEEFEQAAILLRQNIVATPRKLFSWSAVFRLIVWVVFVTTIFLLWSLFQMTK